MKFLVLIMSLTALARDYPVELQVGRTIYETYALYSSNHGSYTINFNKYALKVLPIDEGKILAVPDLTYKSCVMAHLHRVIGRPSRFEGVYEGVAHCGEFDTDFKLIVK